MNLFHRVKPKLGGDAFGDDVQRPFRGGFGVFGGEEEKVGGGFFGEFGEFAVVDAVSVGDDLGRGGLPEDGAQAGDGGHAAGNDIPQHIPRTDGGELIHIAHEEEVGARFEGAEQTVGENQIEHGGFVHHEEVDGERVVFVLGEAARGGVVEHPMDGGGGVAGGFGEAFSGAPSGGGEHEAFVVGLKNVDEGFETSRLTGSGAACQNGDGVGEGGLDGLFLFFGEFGWELEKGGGNVGEAGREGAGEGGEAARDADFAVVEGGEVDGGGGRLVDRWIGWLVGLVGGLGFGDAAGGRTGVRDYERVGEEVGVDAVVLGEAVEGGGDQGRVNGEEFGGFFDQVGLRGVGVAVVRHLVEGVDNASFEAGGVIGGEAEGLGDFVGGFEAHAEDVAGEAVGVGLDDL